MPNYGHFSDNPQTEWITNPVKPDRDMKLLRDFSYTDPEGKVWQAPVGSEINGQHTQAAVVHGRQPLY